MRTFHLNNQKKEDLQQRLVLAFPDFVHNGAMDWSSFLSSIELHPMAPFLCQRPLVWEDSLELQSEHTLIRGENLSILKRMSNVREQVKLIFIDPPYNTGKVFAYSDRWKKNVKEPFFREHGAWLDMMGIRLQYAHALLKEDGVIFICIDDHEMAQLRMLCDSIFGSQNFVQNFIWLHGKGKKDIHSRTLQQYIFCYAKNKQKLSPWTQRVLKSYSPTKNPDNDPRGDWFSGSISFSESRSNPNHPNFFSIVSPTGKQWNRQWLCTKEKMADHLRNNNIYFGPEPTQDRVPRLKMFSFVDEIIPTNILKDCGTTRSAQKRLDTLLGEKNAFLYPKPVPLCKKLIELATEPGDLVLDFFGGSATTLHAAIELERPCICIQREESAPQKSKTQSKWKDVFSMAEHRIKKTVEQQMKNTNVRVLLTCETSGSVLSDSWINNDVR